ncbi:helicase [Acidocella aminolytica 101 = DSM 11237]|nr:helicase [Acidocella aminolytica 101 = DSM 11237]
MRAAYAAGHRAPLLVAPTGAGKTIMFSDVALRAAEKNMPTLILAHRRELIRQASKKLTLSNVPHGIIAPGFTPTRDLVRVGSVQTVARRLDRPEAQGFKLIVIDEAHHAVAGQWDQIITANPKARLLGVTATPERQDGRGLGVAAGGCFDVLVDGPKIGDLIADGYLVRTKTYAPSVEADVSNVPIRGGDYVPDALAEVMDTPAITGDVVAHYARYAPGLPTIVFCANRKHGEHVAQAFSAAGWRAAFADGTMKGKDRDAALGGLETGAVQVLCVADLVSEGVDIPTVSCVISVRKTTSLGLWMQQVGRGLRTVYAPGFDLNDRAGRLLAIAASNKPHLILLDHSGNTLRHGLPDTERDWSLDGKCKKERTAPTLKQCPGCFAIHQPAPVCPHCGHDYNAGKATLSELPLVSAPGELKEVDEAMAARIAQLRKGKLTDILTGSETLAELREIGKARGYSPQWPWMQFQEAKRRREAKKAA